MDNDLDRSIRLLENALSTSNRGLFKKSFGKSKLATDNISNVSIASADDDLRNIISKSFLTSDNAVSRILQSDQTVTGNVLQASTAPWKTALDSLYTEFFEILTSHSGGFDILEVVTDLARCCSDALKVIQSLKSKVAVSQLEEEISLEKERNTWRLLFILYQDRLLTQNLMKDDNDEVIQYFGQSEKLCVLNLFKRDSLIRENQLIIDWLESNAADRDDEALLFSDSTVGWENTLHQLQSADTIAFSSSRQIVTQMDPDAPNHQKRPLHDLDAEDEKRLTERIFMEIRCGKLEEAQKLCRHCGHAWKAALYEGWRLFHDPNTKDEYESENTSDNNTDEEMDSDEMKDIEGNINRDIWKNMAIKFCKQEYLSLYERAAIATFCGYLSSILTVCNSWEDSLWAYMKTMVDIRVESEIRDCVQRNNDYLPLPEEYWNQKLSLNEIFSNLESSKNVRVREEARKPEHIIQKYIILDEIQTLLLKFEEWIEEDNVPTNFLRFLAHLVLFFEQIGQGHHRGIIEKVLEAYIRRIMLANETQLVAFYVSKLNPSNQVHLYAKYLEKIIDQQERKSALIFAEDSGLEVHAITKQVLENIRNLPHETEENGSLQHKITEVDKYKISCIDWILYYEEQRAEALFQINALIFAFLTLGKLDAAQLAFNKVPPNSVEKILNEGKVNDKINQTIKEFLCYKAYLDAQEAFSEWFKHRKSQPTPPDSLPENALFPEKVAHQHRESQYKAELGRWKLSADHMAKNAKAKLYNVLLFPDGWIVGAAEEYYLRSTCIPEVVLLLYAVLYESGQHEECVQLADILASEKYGIYKVYSKEKLGEILVKLCESSVALLNAKKDPWGNETSA
ncbi:nuclear pore complex protein Nup107 [Diabrotica virgifera virgifera]|uniref:Nuclear pore complex protein n=1 Tax=Diabrotica virgifera virgifera TaxID=50390 RepID=A0ABM5KH31_DIAVI|nr:nuclear pore complex protein Nup107 [Diabrotica virgifera virgifera]